MNEEENLDIEDESSQTIQLKDQGTQTSKTILQLAAEEIAAKKSLNVNEIDLNAIDFSQVIQHSSSASTPSLISKTQRKDENIMKPLSKSATKACYNDKNSGGAIDKFYPVPQMQRFTIREIRVKSVNVGKIETKKLSSEMESFCSSTASMLEGVDCGKHGRSLSPSKYKCHSEQSTRTQSVYMGSENSDLVKCKDMFHILLAQVKNTDWDLALKGMVEFADQAEHLDNGRVLAHMNEVNQRLIEFLRSPRSHVSRTSCQIAGRFFETVKDTRRPEFDEIVDILLVKTADSNKFIRKDANLALDALVLNIPPFHTVRAIGIKAPFHKNDLVRITCARLFVCIVGINSPNMIFNLTGNEFTKRRILNHMVKFIKDKNFKVREFGIRLYALLREHPNFEMYYNKFVEKCSLSDLKRVLKEKA